MQGLQVCVYLGLVVICRGIAYGHLVVVGALVNPVEYDALLADVGHIDVDVL